MNVFQTSDGFHLEFRNGKWTDGDLVFESHSTNRDEQWPVDDNGEPLSGRHIQKTCSDCHEDMFFNNVCGCFVCENCDNHDGLARCFCGWSASGGNGRQELEEMGEVIDPEDY